MEKLYRELLRCIIICNGELFKVDHYVKESEENKKTKCSEHPPEAPAVQPHVISEKVVRLPKLVIKPFRGGGYLLDNIFKLIQISN